MLQTPVCALVVAMAFSVRRERDCFWDGGDLARIGLAYALAQPLWIPAFAGMTLVVHSTRTREPREIKTYPYPSFKILPILVHPSARLAIAITLSPSRSPR